MVLTNQVPSSTGEWKIPFWLKAALSLVFISLCMISYRTALVNKGAGGFSATNILGLTVGLLTFVVLMLACFWLFPNGKPALVGYFLIRFLRGPICATALVGSAILVSFRLPLLTIRGMGSLIMLITILSIGLFVKPVAPNSYPIQEIQRLTTRLQLLTKRINATPRWIVGLFVSILPVLMVCGALYFCLNARIQDYHPYSQWNDETGYWLWVRAFSHGGLNVGYNAPNELIAKVGFNHYGEGSPMFVYIYGSIAKLVGWSDSLPLFINFAILALAVFFFTQFTRLDSTQILLTGLVLTITWPVPLYLLMTTQETLNQVIGIILAAGFFRLLYDPQKAGPIFKILFTAVIIIATLTRLSWGLMLFPAIFYLLEGKTIIKRVLISVGVGTALYLLAMQITTALVPPVNNSIFLGIQNSARNGPLFLLDYCWKQIDEIIRSGPASPNFAVTLVILVISSWNAARLFRQVKTRTSMLAVLKSSSTFELFSSAILLLAGLLFYLQVGFFRTFAPTLLLISLLQIARRDYKILGTLMLINLAFITSYLNWSYMNPSTVQVIQINFTEEFPEKDLVQRKMEEYVVYDPSAQDPWCNTLLIPLNYYDYRLTVVPPGIGISYLLRSERIQMPIKSRYLLLDRAAYDYLGPELNAELLESMPIGDLYRNLDSNCAASE